MSTKFCYRFRGQDVGPLTIMQMREHASSGLLTSDMEVRRDGTEEWVSAWNAKDLLGIKVWTKPPLLPRKPA